MRRFSIALITASTLGWSCQSAPPSIARSSLPEHGQVVAHDLDLAPRRRPTEEELSGSSSVEVDSAEFFDLIASAVPGAGESLWKGGFLVVVHGGTSDPELYQISHYGGFFLKSGQPGYYQIPASNQARWEGLWNGVRSELYERSSVRRNQMGRSD